MSMKKKKSAENYLDFIPRKVDKFTPRADSLDQASLASVEKGAWYKDEEGIVTLLIENRGIMNSLAQRILKKPRITQVHLEKFGSFIWQSIDGKKTVYEIGEEMKAHFGEDAEPLYERLVTYMNSLSANEFITF